MPSAYLIAVAEGSSLDHDSKNLTLFKLIEQIQVTADATFPGVLPYEVHSFWSFTPEEVGRAYEARMITEGDIRMASEAITFTADKSRMRLRMTGLGLPSLGNVRVSVEIRIAGSADWSSSPIAWPLLVERSATAS